MKYLNVKWIHRAVYLLFLFSFMWFIKQNELLLFIKQRHHVAVRSIASLNESQSRVLSRKYMAKAENDSLTDLIVNVSRLSEVNDLPAWRQFRRSDLSVFILSAIGTNTTNLTGYRKTIILNGWEARKHWLVGKKCCVLWQTGRYSSYRYPAAYYWKRSSNLPATQYTCPIKGPLVDVIGVTLEFYKKPCPRDKVLYQKVLIPQKQKDDSLALCAKIVYGDVDVHLLVDWLEYYREMKVDKIFMFTYNLTRKAEIILDYYTRIGFLERKLYNFPWNVGDMTRVIGKKVLSVWQDEQVTVFDCTQRLQGYTYMAIIDLDEFLLPRKHDDLKEMMKYLTSHYPTSAGFTFKSYIFAKDWKTTINNGSDIYRFINRTTALLTREKNIVLRERIEPSRMHTHEFEPRAGYTRTTVHPTIAAINHYRVCYSNLKRVCNDPKRHIEDTAILQVAKRFQDRARKFDAILNTVAT